MSCNVCMYLYFRIIIHTLQSVRLLIEGIPKASTRPNNKEISTTTAEDGAETRNHRIGSPISLRLGDGGRKILHRLHLHELTLLSLRGERDIILVFRSPFFRWEGGGRGGFSLVGTSSSRTHTRKPLNLLLRPWASGKVFLCAGIERESYSSAVFYYDYFVFLSFSEPLRF